MKLKVSVKMFYAVMYDGNKEQRDNYGQRN